MLQCKYTAFILLLFTVHAFTTPVTAQPIITNERVKLVASDGASGDDFGWSVAISGDSIVVSARRDEVNGITIGSAYLFERNVGGEDNWGEVTKLLASDGASGDDFGWSVAISGDTVVVGSRQDSDNGFFSGSAYLFERDEGGVGNWGEVIKLLASDGATGDNFGSSVAISGDTVVVGAHRADDNGIDSGSAYLFERNEGGMDNWGEFIELVASDVDDFDELGASVAISGDTVVVGARGDDDNGIGYGTAYLFERNEGGMDNWGEVTELLAVDRDEHDIFGGSVAINGDLVVVGARGDNDGGPVNNSAYLFERNEGGVDNWGEVTKLVASDDDSFNNFGISVAIRGDSIVVGATGDDDNGTNSGSAYLFERNEGGVDNWGEVTKLLASDGDDGDILGWSVAISGDSIVVGARGDDDAGLESGSAYIFNSSLVELSIDANQDNFTTGETLTVSLIRNNSGFPVIADFYAGVILPGLSTVFSFTSPGMVQGSFSDFSTFVPFDPGIDLSIPFSISEPDFFDYTWVGNEPIGTYTLYLAAAVPGAFADGTNDPGDIYFLETTTFTFGP